MVYVAEMIATNTDTLCARAFHFRCIQCNHLVAFPFGRVPGEPGFGSRGWK